MTTTRNAKFEALLQLEDNCRAATLKAALGWTPQERSQGEDVRKTARAALYAALGDLTPEEMAAFGEYRAAARS